MRGYLEKDTPNENLSARQDLTMPPDLRLPPPGTTAKGTIFMGTRGSTTGCSLPECSPYDDGGNSAWR